MVRGRKRRGGEIRAGGGALFLRYGAERYAPAADAAPAAAREAALEGVG